MQLLWLSGAEACGGSSPMWHPVRMLYLLHTRRWYWNAVGLKQLSADSPVCPNPDVDPTSNKHTAPTAHERIATQTRWRGSLQPCHAAGMHVTL